MTAIPSWEFGREICADFERSSRLEWLEGNGLGGWASSTVSGAHTRRYHGLLVAATEPPVGRKVLLSRLDETVVAGSETFELGASRYPGAVHPQGFRHLMRFAREPFPTFDFEIGPARLRKTIAAVHGENATLVLYELLAADAPVRLTLRPFFAGRDFHALGRANDFVHHAGVFENSTFRYASYDGVPAVFVHVPGGIYAASSDWYYRFQYDLERERGLDFEEDLFTPGTITVDLAAGERLGVLISTEPPAGRDAWDLAAAERARREGLLERFGNPDPFCRALALAADAFLVRRDETLSTVIAGYPWFSDWGRDAMIALPGLCLVTRRFDEAKGILRAFANAASEGMLPNRFPDASPEAGGRPEYNTADATLWLFVAAWRYFEATADGAFVRDELMPVLKDVLAWHERGTRHGIRVEPDGLLHAGEPGVQLTWMDAKVGDWVVTPRTGKPVEIQALWANALAIFAELAERFGRPEDAGDLRRRALGVRDRFAELFWYEEGGYLADVVDIDAGGEGASEDGRDTSLRPNQLLALSLPFPLLEGERAERLLRIVEEKLLTPRGLRTLSPEDPRYRPIYVGGPRERDSAYHQGTVWPWLLGPYLTALARVRGEAGKVQGREILARFAPHLAEAGLGTVSEIFDAEPPHAPRGCPAQAWSVGELLRAAVEDLGLGARASEKAV